MFKGLVIWFVPHGRSHKKKKRKKERKKQWTGNQAAKTSLFPVILPAEESVQSRELTAASAPVRTYCLLGFGSLCIPKQSRKPKLPLPTNNIVDFNLL